MKIRKMIAAFAAAVALFASGAQAQTTYTSNLRIAQQGPGSNNNTWGTIANASFAMLDAAISSVTSVSVTVSDVTLTTANNASDQARSAMLIFTGTPGVTRTVTVPNVQKIYQVWNNSNASVVLTAGAGTTVTIPSSYHAAIYSDGSTNVASQNITQTIGGALNVASGKTLTVSNSLAFTGTDGTSFALPATSATLARTDAANTFIGHQTIEGVTSTGATGTGKLVYDTAPTIQSITVPGNILVTGAVNSTLSGSTALSNSFVNALSIGTAGAANNQSYHVTAWIQGTTITASADVILSASVANLSNYANSGGGLTMNNNGGSGSLLINYTGAGTVQYTIMRQG